MGLPIMHYEPSKRMPCGMGKYLSHTTKISVVKNTVSLMNFKVLTLVRTSRDHQWYGILAWASPSVIVLITLSAILVVI